MHIHHYNYLKDYLNQYERTPSSHRQKRLNKQIILFSMYSIGYKLYHLYQAFCKQIDRCDQNDHDFTNIYEKIIYIKEARKITERWSSYKIKYHAFE